MSKRNKYGITGSIFWLLVTWFLGEFGFGLTGWWFDLLIIVSFMESFSVLESIMAMLHTKTFMAILGGWIFVWVMCWAVFREKGK